MYVGHRTHFSVLSAQGHTGLLRKAARAGVLPWAHLAPAATGHWGILLGSAGAQWGGGDGQGMCSGPWDPERRPWAAARRCPASHWSALC